MWLKHWFLWIHVQPHYGCISTLTIFIFETVTATTATIIQMVIHQVLHQYHLIVWYFSFFTLKAYSLSLTFNTSKRVLNSQFFSFFSGYKRYIRYPIRNPNTLAEIFSFVVIERNYNFLSRAKRDLLELNSIEL